MRLAAEREEAEGERAASAIKLVVGEDDEADEVDCLFLPPFLAAEGSKLRVLKLSTRFSA